MKDKLAEIKARHEATLLINWSDRWGFNPDEQPSSFKNACVCHADRAWLLAEVERLQESE
jgi:hypothetical protein